MLARAAWRTPGARPAAEHVDQANATVSFVPSARPSARPARATSARVGPRTKNAAAAASAATTRSFWVVTDSSDDGQCRREGRRDAAAGLVQPRRRAIPYTAASTASCASHCGSSASRSFQASAKVYSTWISAPSSGVHPLGVCVLQELDRAALVPLGRTRQVVRHRIPRVRRRRPERGTPRRRRRADHHAERGCERAPAQVEHEAGPAAGGRAGPTTTKAAASRTS